MFEYPRSIHENKVREYFNIPDNYKIDKHKFRSVECVVICFSNRCGSNFLASALEHTGRVWNANECFNWDSVIARSERRGTKTLEEYVQSHIDDATSSNRLLSLKLWWGQLYFLTSVGVIPQLLRPIFIHITRKNSLSQAISFSIAKQSKKWASTQRFKEAKVVFDEQDILECLWQTLTTNARFEAYFELFGIDSLKVTYEELDKYYDQTMRILLDSLALVAVTPPDRGQIPLKRQANQLNQEFMQRLRARHDLMWKKE
ncbi:MAG: Stf0 family sulfotransferase [Hyphomicrobiales bacterium]|nr:Stf0 family sulfotransferase [Hyphomicrobiales bacterium]